MPWLFGRRKSGKTAKLKEGRPAAVTDSTSPVAAQSHPTRQRSGRRRRTSSRSTGSLHAVEKPENIHPALRKEPYFAPGSIEDITALPSQRRLQHSPHLRPITQEHAHIPYNFHSQSHSSLPAAARGRGKLQRPQSLRKDQPSDSLVRRISSKRRREHDHIREEEIRTMTLPMPQKRPAGSSGGMLRRDSKKVKGGLNHRFERPTSNVSLPLEDSVHSSMSSNSELRAFRVSALDMFSPRPTIRFSVGSQYYSPDRASPTSQPTRNNSRRERGSPVEREEKRRNRTSRIDDLADTLDAGALREIMERDKKRRDKKAKADQDRLRRRLERRAEKQNAAADVGGTPATPRREAVGAVGLGIERPLTPMEDVRPSTPTRPQRLDLPTTPKRFDNSQLPTPMDSPTEEPVVSDARAIRYSRGSVSNAVHTRGPSNVSQLPELISEKLAQDMSQDSVDPSQDPFRSGSLHAVDTVETATSRRGSTRRRSSEGRRMGVFASWFRRGKRNSQDQGKTTPSEISFSNTSRESMSRQPLPAHLVGTAPPPTAPIQIRRPSSVPRRTMSKFREDLPEFPLSPPDSRVQSPDVPATSALAARRKSPMPSDLRVESLHSRNGARSDSPVSPNAPPANIMSQSLASVDSEASWLSGKPPKRASTQSQLRSGVMSSPVLQNETFNASYEELGMADDEYFRRLTPRPEEPRKSGETNTLGRKASSTLMALDTVVDPEEEQAVMAAQQEVSSSDDEIVRTVPGRQRTIIHRQPRVKSTEGLLSFYTNEKPLASEPTTAQATEPHTPESPTSDTEPAMVQRAKSVELGKNHVRHLSAGSARLLDISKQKRSSVQSHSKKSEVDQ
ncbi:hypothetical protein IQ06DRAFT_216589 [Phaeosphaeriaceae sp. SRC1lsM3a]|nr:hypothetical protein IQ06DRAFT_216589 [Stagonospora sp. SRC1lsM3a]